MHIFLVKTFILNRVDFQEFWIWHSSAYFDTEQIKSFIFLWLLWLKLLNVVKLLWHFTYHGLDYGMAFCDESTATLVDIKLHISLLTLPNAKWNPNWRNISRTTKKRTNKQNKSLKLMLREINVFVHKKARNHKSISIIRASVISVIEHHLQVVKWILFLVGYV